MKKIINNKVYDTYTAKYCGYWDNGLYTTDFDYCCEALYQKKTGEFFRHGFGGAMSKYASHNGNNSDWGEQIKPLTYDEAREWAKKYLNANDYIGIFGEPEESDETANLHIQISKAAYTKIKQSAAKQGVSLAKYIESIV